MKRRVRQSTPLVVHGEIPALSLAAMYSLYPVLPYGRQLLWV